MKMLKVAVLTALVTTAAFPAAAQEDARRLRLLPFSEMSPEQRAYAEGVMKGPASKTGSAAIVQGAGSIGSPYNLYLRSPVLAEKLLKVAQHIRFNSVLPARLNEFAILITARQWGAQYEWYAHHHLALKAGLSPSVAEDLSHGKRPAAMSDDEAAVYDFSQELHTTHVVSDATYKAVVDRFGEQGLIELIAVNGYYVLVSMLLNVDRSPLPPGVPPPLQPLK